MLNPGCIASLFKDLFVPTVCPVCWKSVERSGICKACLDVLDGAFLADSLKEICADDIIIQCRSVFSYQYEQVKSLVLFMKENPQRDVYMYAASYLAREIAGFNLDGETLVTCVPRSDEGLRENGFDQSELLAKVVSSIVPEVHFAKLLKRKGKSSMQKRLGGKEREENVKGKFCAMKTKASPKNIVIVDDVFTTGSSLKECASVLLNVYSDACVYCVTVARNT